MAKTTSSLWTISPISGKSTDSETARNGISDVVMTDNGPQFALSEFALFAREWGFEHRTSRPGHQQANGKAESEMSRRLDERYYQVETEEATYRRNRVDPRKTQEANQPDIITRHQVNSGNVHRGPQSAHQPIPTPPFNDQKSHFTRQPTPAPPIKKPKLGRPNKPPNQTSVPTEARPKRAVREPAYLKDYIRK